MPRPAHPRPSPRSAELEKQLTDGYARVHRLERRALSLERRCWALLGEGEDGEQFKAMLTARRTLERDVDELRRDLDAMKRSAAPV